MQLTRIVVILALVFFVIFLLQNMTVVPVNFLAWSMEMPRALLLLFAFLLGYLAAIATRMTRGKKPASHL